MRFGTQWRCIRHVEIRGLGRARPSEAQDQQRDNPARNVSPGHVLSPSRSEITPIKVIYQ